MKKLLLLLYMFLLTVPVHAGHLYQDLSRVYDIQKKVFVTTTGTSNFTVPSDYLSLVSIECIGPGGKGSTPTGPSLSGGGGGGGGAYCSITSASLTAGTTITNACVVPTNGSTTKTSFTDNTASIVVAADYGRTASGNTGGVGGAIANNFPASTGKAGGNGGNGTGGSGNYKGGGAGGAGGPTGSSGSPAAGANGSSGATGAGGKGDGTAGGAGGTRGSTPNGAAGTEWDSTHGAGGGGAGCDHDAGFNAGDGGAYGAGGGGDGFPSTHVGQGSQGLIVFTYNASVSGNYVITF